MDALRNVLTHLRQRGAMLGPLNIADLVLKARRSTVFVHTFFLKARLR
jgi:hypothetical protein